KPNSALASPQPQLNLSRYEPRFSLHGPNELGDGIRVVDRFLELGMIRSRPDVVMEGGDGAKRRAGRLLRRF
ncbi:putative zinc finger protein, partial [Corchorus capsularis]